MARLSKSRKDQIAWWASKIFEQAQEYSDVVDPKRQHSSPEIANRLDAIARLAKEIHWHLKGKARHDAI